MLKPLTSQKKQARGPDHSNTLRRQQGQITSVPDGNHPTRRATLIAGGPHSPYRSHETGAWASPQVSSLPISSGFAPFEPGSATQTRLAVYA